MTPDSPITELLGQLGRGRGDAADALLPLVYEELRSLAAAFFRDQRPGHTLQPTALVHEAYMKLAGSSDIHWSSRNQFFALAAKAMRNILVDQARAKKRIKRGGGRRPVSIDVTEVAAAPERDVVDIVALDEALAALAELDERHARLVELRFFGGLNEQSAADVLGISRSTAAEEWRLARAWLKKHLKGGRA